LHQVQERIGRVEHIAAVQTFEIHVVNSDFHSSNAVDAPSFEDARRLAMKAALQIGTEEVCRGVPFFGAEVTIEADGLQERFLVSIGQSPLINGGGSADIDSGIELSKVI
jgi:hypothetical protein